MSIGKLLKYIKDETPWELDVHMSSNPLQSERWTVIIAPVGCGVYSCGIHPTIVHGKDLEDTLEDGIAKASARKFKYEYTKHEPEGLGEYYAEEITDE